MPKPGYKSITIPEQIYDKFKTYKDTDGVKNEMGAYSLSKYVSFMLEERMMKDEVFAKNAPMLKKIGIDDDRIILRDKKINRIVEVVVKNNTLYCELCEAENCIHSGFCYAMPEVYTIMKKKGSL